jgi:hypothetical protein
MVATDRQVHKKDSLERKARDTKAAGEGSDGNNALGFTMRASLANCNLALHKQMQLFVLLGACLQGSRSGAAIASYWLFEPGFVEALRHWASAMRAPVKTSYWRFLAASFAPFG